MTRRQPRGSETSLTQGQQRGWVQRRDYEEEEYRLTKGIRAGGGRSRNEGAAGTEGKEDKARLKSAKCVYSSIATEKEWVERGKDGQKAGMLRTYDSARLLRTGQSKAAQTLREVGACTTPAETGASTMGWVKGTVWGCRS